MIKVDAWQNCKTTLLLRRLSTGNERPRPRATLKCRLLDRHYAIPLLPISNRPTGLVANATLPKPSLNVRRRHTASDEITIASDAPSLHTSRGFLPWRFAYAGPPACTAPPSGWPASANLHKAVPRYFKLFRKKAIVGSGPRRVTSCFPFE